MQKENTIKEEIKGFILRAYKLHDLEDTNNLFETGYIHSLFFIQLLIYIEKNFNIELEHGEFNIHGLNTIQKISELVHSKLQQKQE